MILKRAFGTGPLIGGLFSLIRTKRALTLTADTECETHEALHLSVETVMQIACANLDQRSVQILTVHLKQLSFHKQFVYVDDLYPSISFKYGILN